MTETFIANPIPEQVPFADVRALFQLWLDIKAEHGVPMRKHFTPQLLQDHLPYLALMDYEKETDRFCARLIGTAYSEAIGFETTGMYVDELENAEEMHKRHKWLVDHKQPYFAAMDTMSWGSRTYKNYAVIGCPLFDECGEVNMILYRVTFSKMD